MKVLSRLYFIWFLIGLSIPNLMYAFPENVRQGYVSCQSCHISPTGGGVLTRYGQRTAEEFMSTWADEGEAAFLNGAVDLPEEVAIGGDFRALAIHKDNQVYHVQRGFPMQADIELAYTPMDELSAVASFGSYDGTPDSRRHYLMYRPNDNVWIRGGLFFPAFGIQVADHSASIRKRLNFNQGQETYNLEFGYISEAYELIADAILGREAEGISREKGFSGRAGLFLGERSLVGISLLQAENDVWKRSVISPYAIIGFSPTLYLLAQTAWETKDAAISDDPSLPKHSNLHSYMKFGWEWYRGVHLFLNVDDSHSIDKDYLGRQQSIGPGVQWLPRPHLEIEARVEVKLDRSFSSKYGEQATLLLHYYL